MLLNLTRVVFKRFQRKKNFIETMRKNEYIFGEISLVVFSSTFFNRFFLFGRLDFCLMRLKKQLY